MDGLIRKLLRQESSAAMMMENANEKITTTNATGKATQSSMPPEKFANLTGNGCVPKQKYYRLTVAKEDAE